MLYRTGANYGLDGLFVVCPVRLRNVTDHYKRIFVNLCIALWLKCHFRVQDVKDPTETNLKEVPWEDADVIRLAQDGPRCWLCHESSRFIKAGQICDIVEGVLTPISSFHDFDSKLSVSSCCHFGTYCTRKRIYVPSPAGTSRMHHIVFSNEDFAWRQKAWPPPCRALSPIALVTHTCITSK